MSVNELFTYLNVIKGKPVTRIGRTSNMLWIGFGAEITVSDIKGNEVKKSEFALHVQSMWRIVNKDDSKMWLASSDFYSPCSVLKDEEEFNWEDHGNNLFDEKAISWIERFPLLVENLKMNRWGDLLLVFSNGDSLEVFVDSTDDTECWRLLRCNSEDWHLVVTGEGVRLE